MKHFAICRRIKNTVNGCPRFAVNFFKQNTPTSDLYQVMIDLKWSKNESAFVIKSYYIQDTIRQIWNVFPSAQVILI